MKKLVIHQECLDQEKIEALKKLCPFGALEEEDGKLSVNAGCKMCGICARKGPQGTVELIEECEGAGIDKSQWKGIAVFADCTEGEIHPVTYELIGKARQLADFIHVPVYAVLAGYDTGEKAKQLSRFEIDEIFVFDDRALEHFLIEPYTAALAEFINKIHPSVLMVGATNAGRSLAPRLAAHFRTGLTADCTSLEIKENSDLVQIRPAFGGNIMAQIITPNHRPQLCTVRYKIFPAASPAEEPNAKITQLSSPPEIQKTKARIREIIPKETHVDISEADVIVAVGRGVKNRKDVALVEELADALHAQIACTRPLIEAGWFDPRLQIGLSGRTVAPKLIVTIGVSGSVQFAAGMKGADCIIAVNSDPEASIFNIANYGIVGDLYEVIPRLLEQIQKKKGGEEA